MCSKESCYTRCSLRLPDLGNAESTQTALRLKTHVRKKNRAYRQLESENLTQIFSRKMIKREQMWELSLVCPTVELCCWSSRLGCHDTCLTGLGSKAENRAPRPLTRKYGRIRLHCRWRLWAMTNRRTGTDKQTKKGCGTDPFLKSYFYTRLSGKQGSLSSPGRATQTAHTRVNAV